MDQRMTPAYWLALMVELGDPTKPLEPERYESIQRKYSEAGETEPLGVGLSRWWWTGLNDPFLAAGVWHDLMHPLRCGEAAGYVMHDRTEEEVDTEFAKINAVIFKRVTRLRRWWHFCMDAYARIVKLYQAHFEKSPAVNYHYCLPSETWGDTWKI